MSINRLKNVCLMLMLLIIATPAFSQEIAEINLQQEDNSAISSLQSEEIQKENIHITTEQGLELKKSYENSDTNIIEVKDLHGSVKAVQTPEKTPFQAWLQGDHITGEWGGLRSTLEEKGLSIGLNYVNDEFMKFYGGLNNKSHLRPMALLEIAGTLDTKKAGLWSGGTFHIQAHNKVGHSLTGRDLGDLQYYDNTDLPRIMLLSQYWFKQSLFSDKLSVKVGKQNACYDFGATPSNFNFLNVSRLLMPTVPIPAFPNPGLGITATIKPTNYFTFKSGMFDGSSNPEVVGFTTTFDGKDGAVFIQEASFNHSIKNFPGTYIAGYWYDNGDIDEISSTPRKFAGSQGFYTSFDQVIFNENSSNDGQGLLLNTQFGYAPADRKMVSRYYGIGLQYTGLIPKRNTDIFGIGPSIVRISKREKRISGKTGETALELFYLARITPWFAIQPDMQFVFNPGGKGKDAMIFGIRTIFNF